jgi:tripartite-type tricarboxylate transporter receptor subunit TctC
MFDPLVSAIGFIRAGKMRALGVTTTTRRDVLPDVPSIAESVPGYEGDDWTGISTTANTPPEVIGILNREVNAALADPAFKARLTELGVEPFAGSPAAFGKFIGEYTEKWGKVIRAANIKPESSQRSTAHSADRAFLMRQSAVARWRFGSQTTDL